MVETKPQEEVISTLKARTPANVAEEYIVKSIWSNYFPAGSFLPSERELADKIGVTRTTLREVLQRLARDGWLTIQHGKPTKVNDIWETSGLNILEVLIRLDSTRVESFIENVLSARTNISAIYITKAFKVAPLDSLLVFSGVEELEETKEAYTEFDYNLFRGLAFASHNAVYGLILNSLKKLYTRVGLFYFDSPESRELAKQFYLELRQLCQEGAYHEVYACVRTYGKRTGEIWGSIKNALPHDFVEDE